MLRDRLIDAKTDLDLKRNPRFVVHARYRLKPGIIWTTVLDERGEPAVFRDIVSALDAAEIALNRKLKSGDSVGITS